MNVQYFGSAGEDWTHFQCFRGATGLSDLDPNYAQNYKDSTGFFVFIENVPTYFGNPTWNWIRALAFLVAHETGHALGISEHMGNGLMRLPNWNNLYSNYDEFDGVELGFSKTVSINTRDILGRDTIDIRN